MFIFINVSLPKITCLNAVHFHSSRDFPNFVTFLFRV